MRYELILCFMQEHEHLQCTLMSYHKPLFSFLQGLPPITLKDTSQTTTRHVGTFSSNQILQSIDWSSVCQSFDTCNKGYKSFVDDV